MKGKVLFCSNVLSHITTFHLPYIEWLQKEGYEVHIATDAANSKAPSYCDELIDIGINRSPFSLRNITAYRKLKKRIETENYLLIHAHTPVGGVLARLAARKVRAYGTKVIYTAHGFYFYRGAPFINWLVYFNIEKFLSRFTDAIITMNEEDYLAAKSKNFKNKETYLVQGMGVNPNKFASILEEDKLLLRKEYGFCKNDFILISVGEMCNRKDPLFIIENIMVLKSKIPNLKVLFVGKGSLEEVIKQRVKDIGAENIIKVLGFRNDIPNLLHISDSLISASHMEGLPICIVEALLCGLPVIASDIRGQIDLIQHGDNGFLFRLNDKNSFINAILEVYSKPDLRKIMAKRAADSMVGYDIENTLKEMSNIYRKYLKP